MESPIHIIFIIEFLGIFIKKEKIMNNNIKNKYFEDILFKRIYQKDHCKNSEPEN